MGCLEISVLLLLTIFLTCVIFPLSEAFSETGQSSPLEEKPLSHFDFKLPAGSTLTITGQKTFGLKYSKLKYISEAKEEPPGAISIDQTLKVRAKGTVGRKVTVDVEYDDTSPEPPIISIVYKGDPGEIIQEAAIGDLVLSLPGTEFLGYNRSLFGARLIAEVGKFRFTGLATQTKGLTEKRIFRGSTSFDRRDIYDTNYLVRRYYQINLQPSPSSTSDPLPLSEVEIYLDDKIGSNNTSSLYLTVRGGNGETHSGYFDRLNPGQDYTVDNQTGIVTFIKNIEPNYVIAVAYKFNGGDVGYTSDKKMVKDELNTDIYAKYELKNYYFLGHTGITTIDFVLKVVDLNNNEVTSSYTYSVDYVLGLLQIYKNGSNLPFPNAYPLISQHIYTIKVEYNYRFTTFILRPEMVIGSERVRLNGNSLIKDKDYIIDYDSGILTILKPELIREDTVIEVEYEYLPLGGQFKSNLFGGRLEAKWTDSFSTGLSAIYTEDIPTKSQPDIGDAPKSLLVGGFDLKLKPNLTYLFDRFGNSSNIFSAIATRLKDTDLTFGGEISRSHRNPNTTGRAMVDDMEKDKQSDLIPTDRDLWQVASKPLNALGTRGMIGEAIDGWINEDIYGDEIYGGYEHKKREVLVLNYNLPGNNDWVALTYPLSKTGADYTRKTYIEFWAYSDINQTLYLDLGIHSEDADGSGILKTEDTNRDGKLNAGEDIGWIFSNPPLGTRGIIGANNGRLDTNDLDGDGVLETTDAYDEFSYNLAPGWQRLQIPLVKSSTTNWRAVKHIRLWIKGSNVKGTIKLDSIAIVGNKWEAVEPIVDTFSVRAIDKDDPNYISLNGDEGALNLKYTFNGPGANAAQQTFTQAQDYTDYKKLRFWIYNRGASSLGTFFIRFGGETKDNGGHYYYRNYLLSSLPALKWVPLEIKLEEGSLDKVGNPSLAHITQIRLGISVDSATSGEIWINDLEVSDPIAKGGLARKVGVETKYRDDFALNLTYKDIDLGFETLAGLVPHQGLNSLRLDSTYTQIKWLTLKGVWERSSTFTSIVEDPNQSDINLGKVTREGRILGAALSLKRWPKLSLEYSGNEASYLTSNRNDKVDTYATSLEYQVPLRWALLPRSLLARYQFSTAKTIEEALLNKKELTNDWFMSTSFLPLRDLSLDPSYELRMTRDDLREIDRSQNQKVKLQSSLNRFKWFSPRIDYNSNYAEENIPGTTKMNATVEGSFKASTPIIVKELLPKAKYLSSLTFDLGFKNERQGYYSELEEKVGKGFKLGFQSRFDNKTGILTRALDRETSSIALRFQPLEYLGLGEKWRALRSLVVTDSLTFIDEHQENTGTPLDIKTTTWPDLSLTLSELETLPLFKRTLSSSLIAKFAKKRTHTLNVSIVDLYTPSLLWRARWTDNLSSLLGLYYSHQEENSGGVAKRDRTTSPSFSLDYLLGFPQGLKLPFKEERIKLESEIKLTSEMRADFRRSENYGYDNTNKYTTSLGAEYNVARQVTSGLKLSGSYLKDLTVPTESNIFYEILMNLILNF